MLCDDAMLRQSFVFLDRVTLSGEKRIWSQGIADWERFRGCERVIGMGKQRKSFYDLRLQELERELRERRFEAFISSLPKSELWRLFPLFADQALYLDIETAQRYGDITVLGAYDGREYYSFVKGFNMDKDLVKALFSRYRLFVTFNGASFDIPIIEKYFGGVLPQGAIHVDLRHVLARLGYSGGLKTIELLLGISRHEDIQGMEGAEAALLWHEYLLTQDDEMIELLLKYNEADCRNLEPLAEFAVAKLWERLQGKEL